MNSLWTKYQTLPSDENNVEEHPQNDTNADEDGIKCSDIVRGAQCQCSGGTRNVFIEGEVGRPSC